MAWPDHDRDLVLALRHLETEEAANRCPVCGGDARECQDPANQRAYVAEFRRCYRSRAIQWAGRGRESDPDRSSLAPTTRFDKTKRKTE